MTLLRADYRTDTGESMCVCVCVRARVMLAGVGH